jgi:hypothetical protein
VSIKDPGNIKKAVEAVRRQSPVADDIKFSIVKDAEVGSPVMVFTPDGKPSFWMVPILFRNFACGFACVELSGKVRKIGIFGSTSEDRSSWIDSSFFKKPPPKILKEIQTKFSGSTISEPLFSYDTSHDKWAWMLEIRNKDKIKSLVFVTPGGWYEKHLNRKKVHVTGALP